MAEDRGQVDPQALLCFNLYAASHAFTRFYQPLLDPLGLTYPQYLVVLALRGTEGMGVGALSQVVMLDTNTLSPLLKRLQAAGLLLRSRDVADERRVTVRLTEAGMAVADRAADLPECIATCLDAPLADVTGLIDALGRLRSRLAAAAVPPAGHSGAQGASGA